MLTTEYFIISGFFWGGAIMLYLLFLQKRTFHSLNRLYLLFTLFFGACLPFLELPTSTLPATFGAYLQPIVIGLNGAVVVEKVPLLLPNFSISGVLLTIYGIGVVFFLSRLLIGVFKIRRLVQACKKQALGIQKNKNYTLLQSKTAHSPFSFFNMIFIGQEDREHPDILNHELAHVKGKHSWDIILVQILKALHWFNPFLWLYERLLKETHEYIADRYALQYTRKKEYSYILLGQASPIFHVPITSTFHSFTKKRITMIFRKKSKLSTYLFYPLTLVMVFQLSATLLSSCQAQEAEGMIEKKDYAAMQYYTEIDTIIVFDPATLKETRDIVKTKIEIHDKVAQKPVLVSCSGKGDNEEQAACSHLELVNLIMEAIEFPKGQKVEGIVHLKFLIDDHGDLRSPAIVKSLAPVYDKEVLRVFKALHTKWVPAKVEGKAVGFYYTLPIKFTFSKEH